jgi:nucleoside-diphosphate-sugar epimerase
MRVLVSGSSGLIGSAVVERLVAEGDEAVHFDIVGGHDVLDPEDYAAVARGCEAIVHAAGGHRPDTSDPGQRFLTHNVTGNWNMLEAARKAGIRRVVTFSSVNAIGVFRGEGVPDYLPIDDEHPIRPSTAYGMAKRLVEELCRYYTAANGIATVCFRPPAICGPARRAKLEAERAADPAMEWTPYWEYGAWIDVRDVAGAVIAALRRPDLGHLTALIIADDVTSPIPPRELAKRLLPDVPWRGPEPGNEWTTLVRSDRAREALEWRPQFRWRITE